MARRSIRKLSLRSANPRGAKLSAASKRLVKEALEERVANKGKAKGKGAKAKGKGKGKAKGKKNRMKKGSAAAKAWGAKMAAARRRKARGEGKTTPKKARKPKKAGKAGKKAAARKAAASKRGKKMKGTFSGSLSLRAANRGRRAAAARRNNPGFDVKRALIESGVLVVGTFAAAYVMPHASKFLEKTLGLSGNTLGYAKIAGAALTVVGGHYLDSKFGDKLGFDIQPITYALATFMAHDGFINAGLVKDYHVQDGVIMLDSRSMSGMGYDLPAGPSNSMTGMGFMGYLPGSDFLPAAPSNSMTGMGATLGYGGDSGSIFDHDSHMNGSIFTASELPFPPVAPHNVMQGDYRNATFGQQVVKPELC